MTDIQQAIEENLKAFRDLILSLGRLTAYLGDLVAELKQLEEQLKEHEKR